MLLESKSVDLGFKGLILYLQHAKLMTHGLEEWLFRVLGIGDGCVCVYTHIYKHKYRPFSDQYFQRDKRMN